LTSTLTSKDRYIRCNCDRTGERVGRRRGEGPSTDCKFGLAFLKKKDTKIDTSGNYDREKRKVQSEGGYKYNHTPHFPPLKETLKKSLVGGNG